MFDGFIKVIFRALKIMQYVFFVHALWEQLAVNGRFFGQD